VLCFIKLMKIKAKQLLPLILDFIESNFGQKDLKEFKKYFSIDVDH